MIDFDDSDPPDYDAFFEYLAWLESQGIDIQDDLGSLWDCSQLVE